jgi:hypothetical protein
MSFCAACGSELSDETFLCRHHYIGAEDHWAEANRILCDLLHRGKEPERLPKEQREEEIWAM